MNTEGLIESRGSDPLCVQSDPLAPKLKFEDLASQRFVDPSGLNGLGAYFSRKKASLDGLGALFLEKKRRSGWLGRVQEGVCTHVSSQMYV